MNIRKTEKIEIGIYEGKIGITFYYSGAEKEHQLFSLEIGKKIAEKILKCISEIRTIERQVDNVFKENIGISESVQIKISGGKENG